uniref:Uncharacterized protein n=1 Tax=Mycena chlorophos TaxID=658473 RepID=A0ABQ0M0E4_MYCCL|nr:predicted protein [Mycena chlorophos]
MASLPGFGRQRRNSDGSSSSRDSSPTRARPARRLTPTSDDEIDPSQLVAGARDETPPPQNAPIIRASLAFGGSTAFGAFGQSVTTYAPAPVKLGKKPTFLPGQAIPQPPKVRKKRQPRFLGQTTKFRVDTGTGTYDATPPMPLPPTLTLGKGPYSSQYRIKPTPIEPNLSQLAGPSTLEFVSDHPVVNASTSRKGKGKAPARVQHREQSITEAELSPEEEEGAEYVPEMPPTVAHGQAQHKNPTTPARQRNATRLVTLLMEDNRGESRESLLAEVYVPLRESENAREDGYWAYAEEICQELQTSAARIDGPAKVFVLRGKYRQVILRVNEYNEDNWVRGNVVIKPDRTLEVVVERDNPPPPRGSVSHKRRRSPSIESGYRDHRRPHLSVESPPIAGPSRQRLISPQPDASVEENDEETVNKKTVQEVNDLLTAEDEWTTFYRSLGRTHMVGVLSCYTILQGFVDKYVGKPTPSGTLIQSSHIAEALNLGDAIEDTAEKYMERCEATIRLLALYGPSGTRSQDPEVAQMVQDASQPGYGQKPEVALLNKLRALDQQWRTTER